LVGREPRAEQLDQDDEEAEHPEPDGAGTEPTRPRRREVDPADALHVSGIRR